MQIFLKNFHIFWALLKCEKIKESFIIFIFIEFVKVLTKYAKNHGNFFRVWIGNKLHIVLLDPKDVQAVLTDMRMITKSYEFLKPWLGEGLFNNSIFSK